MFALNRRPSGFSGRSSVYFELSYKRRVILNEVKDLSRMSAVREILHFVQNDIPRLKHLPNQHHLSDIAETFRFHFNQVQP